MKLTFNKVFVILSYLILNNFYADCQRMVRPAVVRRPVVVRRVQPVIIVQQPAQQSSGGGDKNFKFDFSIGG